MTAEDYGVDDEHALAAGDVVGHRVWKLKVRPRTWLVDPLGISTLFAQRKVALESVYREYLWEPGENVAHCLPHSNGPWPGPRPGFPVPGVGAARPKVHTAFCTQAHTHTQQYPVEPQCMRDHFADRIDPSHTCGFYAMTDPVETNSHASSSGGSVTIEGVIQGYGLTTIGTKGFRCERARILALVRPRVPLTPGATMAKTNARAQLQQVSFERLADHFGVPLFEDRASMVEAFPLGRRGARLEIS